MDPMEYTMDDNQLPNPSPQCQPQQPHQHSGTGSFTSAAREAHHYDPVHNTDVWFHGSPTDPHVRPPYAAPQNIPSWASRHYTPLQSRQAFGDTTADALGIERQGNRPQPSYMGMAGSHWAPGRDFDMGLPHGYFHGPYGTNGIGSPSDRVMPRPFAHASSTSPPSAHALPSTPQVYPFTPYQAGFQPRANRYGGAPPTPSSNPERRMSGLPPQHALRDPQVSEGEPEQRPYRTRIGAPSHVRTAHVNIMRAYASQESPHMRRRNAQTWDSEDDDDDSIADLEADALRRGAEAPGVDSMDERALAVIRARIAAKKKVPSKEALMALEEVAVQDLKESEQACIICYNELGAVNPDGIMEKPIRLPKCKHIFGDKCIRKWFEDNDTCPYCRDKLPSEAAVRKSIAVESLRAYRTSMIRGMDNSRAQGSLGIRFPGAENFAGSTAILRHPHDYPHAMNHHFSPDHTWTYSSPNRPSGTELPESRRRQIRGRVAANRTASLSNRPTSVGSSRFLAPNSSNPLSAQHPPPFGLQSGSTNPSLPSLSPEMVRNAHSFAYLHPAPPIPRNRPSNNISSASEEASPAVAVGSMAPERGAQITQHQRSTSEHFATEFADPFTTFQYNTGMIHPMYGQQPNARAESGSNTYQSQHMNGEHMDVSPVRNSTVSTPQHFPRSFDVSSSPSGAVPRWTR